jgi:hypothetical protein
LDGVVDVVAVDEFVDAEALLADVVKELRGVAGEDLGDGGVAEHGVQAADAGGEFVRGSAAAGVLNGVDGRADGVDTVSNRVGEVAVEQEEPRMRSGSRSAV